MIKALQRKFIRIAMLAATLLMVVFLLAINISNLWTTNREMTRTLKIIVANSASARPDFAGFPAGNAGISEQTGPSSSSDDTAPAGPADAGNETQAGINDLLNSERYFFVRVTEDGQVMLIICLAREDKNARTALLDAILAQFPQVTSLYYVINEKLNDSIADQSPVLYKGEDAIYESMEGLRFKIGPKSFYQTNSRQAYRLYSVAREFAALQGNEVVYDLYTGTGTIAQFVSKKASKVIGIEYVPEAIADAELNARANGITNCEFFAGDMKDVLNEAFIHAHGKPDVIILDPPRAGIHPDVAQVILKAAPARMVYVSCNPASQARDLAVLCRDYEITAVQPVDMFPHTMHVENVVALKRKA